MFDIFDDLKKFEKCFETRTTFPASVTCFLHFLLEQNQFIYGSFKFDLTNYEFKFLTFKQLFKFFYIPKLSFLKDHSHEKNREEGVVQVCMDVFFFSIICVENLQKSMSLLAHWLVV